MSLTIGEVVRRTGKAASTIRYYEEIGLIPPAERVSGRRRYPPEVVRTLGVVDTAQRAGLSLKEIGLLLEASPADHLAIERLREVAQRKLPELTEAIVRAELVRGWLEDAAGCRCPTLDDCPLFDEPPLPAVSLPSDGERRRVLEREPAPLRERRCVAVLAQRRPSSASVSNTPLDVVEARPRFLARHGVRSARVREGASGSAGRTESTSQAIAQGR